MFEPLETGSGIEFDQQVVGGTVPREYIPGVSKKVSKSAMDSGIIAASRDRLQGTLVTVPTMTSTLGDGL